MSNEKRNTMKRVILLAAFVVLSLAAHAQRFDWVKTYTGPDLNGSETNNIVGSFVDAEGNFYFLGEFSPSASLCGVRLLPQEVVSEQYKSVVVAKLSPSGQLMWHKAIYGPQSSYAYSLCPMGDTAFMVMVGFKMSHNFNSFLYYLDTLLTSSNVGYLQSCDSTASPLTNGFITFRLDGSVAEQHFIELGYIDSTGRPLTIGLYGQPTPAPDALESTVLSSETFTIDNDGNIYIARLTKDYKYILNERFSIDDGTIATYKIMVDGSHPLLYPLEQPSALWNQQILKFSPHFDSLIESTFVFETIGLGDWESLSSKIMSMKTDAYGRLYIATEFEIPAYTTEHPVHLGIVGSDSLLLHLDSLCWVAGCLIQYTAVLIPQQIMQLNYTLGNMRLSMSSYIRDIEIDETNNSIYTLWNISGLHNGDNSMVIYHDTLIDTRNNVLWVRIDRSGFGLISYGVAKSSLFTCFEKLPVCLSIHNNRVFSQLKYVSDITVNDSTIENNNSPGYGMGAFVWDCEGHELGFYEFSQNAFSDAPGQTLAIDSTLFFTGQIFSNANFDTILLSANGQSMAYIAKYVDTSFITPYVPRDTTHTDPIDTGSVRITVVGDEGAFVAYPNPFRQKVTIEVQGGEPLAETAWLTDLTGRRQQMRLTAEGAGRYSLDLTSRPQATYLLTLTTASGKTHTVRLLKQSDLFSR